jgi:hypothetical protein
MESPSASYGGPFAPVPAMVLIRPNVASWASASAVLDRR